MLTTTDFADDTDYLIRIKPQAQISQIALRWYICESIMNLRNVPTLRSQNP